VTTPATTETRPGTRWTAPLIGGVLALATAYVICAGLVAWGQQTFPDSNDGARNRFHQVLPVPVGAGAAILSFQRVPVTVDRLEGTPGPDSRSPEHISYRVVVSPLGGLLLIGLALVAGGAATQRLGRQRSTIASGALTAVVFAVACFALSYVVSHGKAVVPRSPNASLGFTVTYRPLHHAALLWPLVWGFAFGSLGAFIGRHGLRRRAELGTALRAAGTGLATGIALVLLAGVLTAVVGIGLHVSEAGDVLGSGRNVAGIAEGIVVGLPHATGMGLIGSMGIPAHYEASEHRGGGKEFLTAGIFGAEGQRRVFLGGFGNRRPPFERYTVAVPRYALGGLLIAIAFTIMTGYRAAAFSGGDLGQALRSAVAAAACLTIALWIVAYLVSGEADVHLLAPASSASGARATIGPSLLPTLVLTPLWTIGGGVVGALLHARTRRQTAPA